MVEKKWQSLHLHRKYFGNSTLKIFYCILSKITIKIHTYLNAKINRNSLDGTQSSVLHYRSDGGFG